MKKESRIYLAGHIGLVGSAIHRRLKKEGYTNIIVRDLEDLDLTDMQAAEAFFEQEKPEYVFLAAARVGGIHANNTYPAEFIYQNLMIQNNIIHQSWRHNVERLLFLGSSCIYPKLCPQPMKEEYLMTGPLEQTNSPYAVAKIAGIEMCWSYNRQYNTRFIPVMPTNLYGVNDNFDLENSHVLPALIRKFHEAKEADAKTVTAWGTGSPKREFLFVDDLADACVFIINLPDERFNNKRISNTPANPFHSILINIGTGTDHTIKELAEMVGRIVGFKGDLVWDSSKPDGTPRKLLDVSRLHNLGWKEKIKLEDGIKSIYQWYVENLSSIRK